MNKGQGGEFFLPPRAESNSLACRAENQAHVRVEETASRLQTHRWSCADPLSDEEEDRETCDECVCAKDIICLPRPNQTGNFGFSPSSFTHLFRLTPIEEAGLNDASSKGLSGGESVRFIVYAWPRAAQGEKSTCTVRSVKQV